MRTIDTSKIAKEIYSIFSEICTQIDDKTFCALKNARELEKNSLACFALDTLIENNLIAKREKLPVCQDTGMASIFLEIGQDVLLCGEFLEDAINGAVAKCYSDNNFRMSVLDPIDRKNTKTNTPALIHTEIVKGDRIKIYAMAKGFGSENMTRLFMLKPSDDIKVSVLQAVIDASSKPCPPIIVSVGIGGSADFALTIAKKALFREVGSKNDDAYLNNLELELLQKINETNIGAGGFGGNNTCLAVFCQKYATHLAALPVAVCIQCNCDRKKIKVI